MKKIMLFLILVLTTIQVKAQVYYSDYKGYEKVEEKVEESDTVKLKIEDRYLVFKESKIEAFYPRYMEINDMIKTNETKIVESSWLDERPNELIGRNIITGNLYEYQNMKKIRYIKFNELTNTKSKFYFSEIRIYNEAERLDYKILTDKKNINIIKDDDLHNFIGFDEDEELVIDLKENVDITDLRLMVHIYIVDDSDINFKINILGEERQNIYAWTNIHSSLTLEENREASYLIDQDHFKLQDPVYNEPSLSEEEIFETNFRKVRQVTKYKSQDEYVKYEKYEKEYLDDYYLEEEIPEGYQIDLDSKKEFYYIKTRDKVEIKDRLIIDSYDTKLEDFILFTTVDDIKITSNINYYKNGEYDINFILPFKTVKKKVIVDIKENYLKALEEQNKYLDELEKENNNLYKENNNLNSQIKEVLQNKDETVQGLNEKLIKYKYENENLKKDKQDIGEDISKSNYRLILVLLILLILLIIILTYIARKKSHQNNN